MGKIYEDITKTVGGTPIVRINRLNGAGGATVLVKLESFNPLSSVKDRIGVAMIEAAEASGLSGRARSSSSRRAATRALPSRLSVPPRDTS